MRSSSLLALLALIAPVGCDDAAPPAGPAGRVDVALAALGLADVADVVWDVEVHNSAGAVVWQRRLTSSGYGDGAGSASYVGPCDADPSLALNTVRVWVVGVYDAPVSPAAAGPFNATHDGVTVSSLPFENPTRPAAPLALQVPCVEGADAPVRFDVALMRPAQQGFFDVSVNFNDTFCSAKYDCCDDADANGCALDGAEDLRLLFDATGARATTHVLALACTAGVAADVTTRLYLDPLALDCTDPSAASAFAPADLVLDPSAGPGNLCPAGALAACPAVLTGGPLADTYLFQIATFRGIEALTSDGAPAQKVYWNVALGVTPDIADCRLRAAATADDASVPGDRVSLGTIAAGAVYPVVTWDVPLDPSCGSRALTFGDPAAPVRVSYTATTDPARPFAYGFGPSFPAGGFCSPACDALSTCVSGVCVPPPPRVVPCTGLAANAAWNTAASITQTWSGAAWLPTAVGVYDTNPSTTTCRFACPATHPLWDGVACRDTRTAACTGLPAQGVWNTAASITQTWDGSAWLPTTVGVYDTNPSTTACRYSCNSGYTGTGCVAAGCTAGQQLFAYTGADQSFTVPSGCTHLVAKLWGAGGGAGYGSASFGNSFTAGGAGGYTWAAFTVTPGATFTVVVGRGGWRSTGVSGTAYGGGGATASTWGGGVGGGRSALRQACGDLATAGGGGGGSCSQTYSTQPGGAGGGVNGGTPDGALQSGGGASQTAGGAAGAYNGATAGAALLGGSGSAQGGHGSSGGGGGYFGGGGSNIGGGGGGSGYYGGCGGLVPTSGATTAGNGTTPPATGDAHYPGGGVGQGGNTTGGNGAVMLIWSS